MNITLTVTPRGVLSLPVKMRKALGLKPGTQLIAEITPEGLLLRPAVTIPIEIYDEKRLSEFELEEAAMAKILARRKKL